VPIALHDDQLALAAAVSGFVARHASVAQTREHLDELSAGAVPAVWPALVEQGYATVHLPDPYGGGTHLDLAVVIEEAGRGLLPGPLLATAVTSAVLARAGARDDLIARFGSGARGATALEPGALTAQRSGDGWTVTGTTGPVLGAVGADLLLLAAQGPDGVVWLVVDPDETPGVQVEAAPVVDLTRGIGTVTLDGAAVGDAAVVAVTTGQVRAVAAALFAAEAAGIAAWCVAMATDYAKIREQFGRSIGSFQSIKHKLARLFITVQLMCSAAWDAARALDDDDDDQLMLAAAEAAIVCFPAAGTLALETVTLLGGIGYTWEHDTHLYWRRVMTLGSLLGPAQAWQRDLGDRSRRGGRRFEIELLDEDPQFRQDIAATLAKAAELPDADRQPYLAAAGLVLPHYPPPYGLAATAVQQVVIAQEYERSGVAQPRTVIGEWALPTILAHGSPEQQETFVPATLRGEIHWCQLFSEPGAGSDLASLATKAEQVDGGWRLSGQKIWTSSAKQADWGICLARTDPTAAKHRGISYFLVDMHSPGLEVRPLREANGHYLFNEVFFDDVFVPDDRMVGEVNGGWKLARTTLSNERVSMGGMVGSRLAGAPFSRRDDLAIPPDEADRSLGELTAESYVLMAMNLRDVVRRISGLQPGVEGSAIKVAAGWHAVNVSAAAMQWVGPYGALADGDGGEAAMRVLSTPPVLIGGGTLEIQLNVIGERVLGLPRD
jgi:alkylation response protein AidB-like acyl-CoA dehydrogenase